MNKENLDWLDCSLFLMLASAEITDHYLTEEEINTIIEKAQALTTTYPLDGTVYDREAIIEKFNKAFEWYNYIGETAPQGKMNKLLMKEVFDLTAHMKAQPWFSSPFAQTLLNDLVTIADADGETIKNEQQLINKVADAWNLTQPFS
jgi:hypothetical protein